MSDDKAGGTLGPHDSLQSIPDPKLVGPDELKDVGSGSQVPELHDEVGLQFYALV